MRPCCAAATAIWTAAVVLPLPPFMLTSATVLMLPPGGGVRAVRACPRSRRSSVHTAIVGAGGPFLEAAYGAVNGSPVADGDHYCVPK